MSYTNWLNYLESAEKIAQYTLGDKKRILYKFPDGKVMLEEYSTAPDTLMRRCWQCTRKFNNTWNYEVGKSAAPESEQQQQQLPEYELKEVTPLPVVTKRSTKRNFEWRITNMIYPLEVYNVAANLQNNTIEVKTSNRKYFKVLELPDLQRCQLTIEPARISFRLQQQTLIITYEKPDLVKQMDQAVLERMNNVWLREQIQSMANSIIERL